jgi:hypothetical protein
LPSQSEQRLSLPPDHVDGSRVLLSLPIDSRRRRPRERRLDDLSDVVRRQRAAVATDDMDAVSDCVSRRTACSSPSAKRAGIEVRSVRWIGLREAPIRAEALVRSSGRWGPDDAAIRAARDELHAAARALAREPARVAKSRRVKLNADPRPDAS